MLVLSENAGAHEELGEWALTVNPFDSRGQAEALLRSADDAGGRAAPAREAIRAHVRAHDFGVDERAARPTWTLVR